MRPRCPGESLKSPFEQPEIAFSYLVGVGATGACVYAADALARRLLRLKLTYAAEAGCAIE